jgi:hypothetical protein
LTARRDPFAERAQAQARKTAGEDKTLPRWIGRRRYTLKLSPAGGVNRKIASNKEENNHVED